MRLNMPLKKPLHEFLFKKSLVSSHSLRLQFQLPFGPSIRPNTPLRSDAVLRRFYADADKNPVTVFHDALTLYEGSAAS